MDPDPNAPVTLHHHSCLRLWWACRDVLSNEEAVKTARKHFQQAVARITEASALLSRLKLRCACRVVLSNEEAVKIARKHFQQWHSPMLYLQECAQQHGCCGDTLQAL